MYHIIVIFKTLQKCNITNQMGSYSLCNDSLTLTNTMYKNTKNEASFIKAEMPLKNGALATLHGEVDTVQATTAFWLFLDDKAIRFSLIRRLVVV